MTEVHVGDAIAGIALPEDAASVKGRAPAANQGPTVLDYRQLGDWLEDKGFLTAAERADAWGELEAMPLPEEAPPGTTFGRFMVPRARLMPARTRAPKPAPAR